jgi:hypothetical protein
MKVVFVVLASLLVLQGEIQQWRHQSITTNTKQPCAPASSCCSNVNHTKLNVCCALQAHG